VSAKGGSAPGFGRLTPRQLLRRRASDALAAQGLHEVVGWSFVSPELAGRLRLEDAAALELENPMSADQSHLRTTLLGSLLDVARLNRSRGVGTIRLFEGGAVYLPRGPGELPAEPFHLGALLTGPVRPPGWREDAPPGVDFFTAKGVLEGLLETLRVDWTVRRGSEPFLHPGRSATVQAGDLTVGWVGELHPLVAAQWDLPGTVAGFELDLDALPDPESPIYVDVTSFPEVREDLAVVVSERVSAAEVLNAVLTAGRPLLGGAQIFDVYHDAERLGAGNVSLALRLSYRAADRTLTDEEVAAQRESIVIALEDKLGGKIRVA
jgi:phenylalanyl-tRNA synthetase beta chain